MRAQVTGEVRGIWIYVRPLGGWKFVRLPLRPSTEGYAVDVPSELVRPPGIEYYIKVEAPEGSITAPEAAPYGELYRVEVEEGFPPEVVVLNPEPDAQIEGGDPVIAVSLLAPGGIVPGSLKLRVDGRDVGLYARLSGPLVTYIPRPPLSPGTHTVEVEALSRDGQSIGPAYWSFTIRRPGVRRLRLEGEVGVDIQYDRPSRHLPYVPLWDNRVRIKLGGRAGGIAWEGSISLTSREESWLTTEEVEPRQPLNRYRLRVRTRFGELIWGDAHPTLSELTLWGVFVRGLHGRARMGPLRINFVHGWTKRAIAPQVVELLPETWIGPQRFVLDDDTLSLAPSDRPSPDSSLVYSQEKTGTFRREVGAVRLSVGGEIFEAGVNLMGIWDDTTSLPIPGPLKELYRPKQNYVASLFARLALDRRRTVLSAEVGGTVITDNAFSEISDTTLAGQIPPWVEGFLKINASTRTTADITDLKANLRPRLYRLGLRTSILRILFLKAEYYRIPTNYISLGSPQRRPDVQGWRFHMRSSFLRGQAVITCGGERYHDNVDGGSPITTTMVSWDLSLQLSPTSLPKYSPFLELGFRSQGGQNDAEEELMKLSNRTGTFTFGLGARVPTWGLSHRFRVRTGYTAYRDFVSPTAGYTNRSLMLWASPGLPSSLTLDLTTSRTVQRQGERRISIRMWHIRAAYKPGNWRLSGELSTTASSDNLGEVDTDKLAVGMGVRYTWREGSTIEGAVRLVRFLDRVAEDRSYTEPVVSLSWRQQW